MGRHSTDKKERLIEAALTRFHRYGVMGSSLASVANDARVPPGNVFYYFRTKEALSAAVIHRWCDRVTDHLDQFEAMSDPLQRVRAFLAGADEHRQGYADFGCPLIALKGDLRLASPALAGQAGRPLAIIRNWLTGQFGQAGFSAEAARGHADFCLSGLHGSYVLAHATGDAAAVSRTVEQLLGWIDSLAD